MAKLSLPLTRLLLAKLPALEVQKIRLHNKNIPTYVPRLNSFITFLLPITRNFLNRKQMNTILHLKPNVLKFSKLTFHTKTVWNYLK